jgi:Zn-dependent M16 (insulinase) family peptidase
MADRAEDLASVMLDLLLRTDYANEARFRTLAAEQLASMESAVRHSGARTHSRLPLHARQRPPAAPMQR